MNRDELARMASVIATNRIRNLFIMLPPYCFRLELKRACQAQCIEFPSMPLRKSEKCTCIVSAGPFLSRASATLGVKKGRRREYRLYAELSRDKLQGTSSPYPWRLEGKGLG